MKDETRELQTEFAVIVEKYCNAFAKKHGWQYDKDMWAAGDMGGIIEMCDMFINFDDIRTDIDNEFDANAFAEWYWYEQRTTELGCTQHINYRSFALGAPKPYSDEVLKKIEDAIRDIERMQRGENTF